MDDVAGARIILTASHYRTEGDHQGVLLSRGIVSKVSTEIVPEESLCRGS